MEEEERWGEREGTSIAKLKRSAAFDPNARVLSQDIFNFPYAVRKMTF
jgi:hypothetical protein